MLDSRRRGNSLNAIYLSHSGASKSPSLLCIEANAPLKHTLSSFYIKTEEIK